MGPARFHCATPLHDYHGREFLSRILLTSRYFLTGIVLMDVPFRIFSRGSFYKYSTRLFVRRVSTENGLTTTPSFLELNKYLLSAGLRNAKEKASDAREARWRDKYLHILKKRCEIFGEIYNPEGKRIGNRYLERPMQGAHEFAYWPTDVKEIADEKGRKVNSSLIVDVPLEGDAAPQETGAGMAVLTSSLLSGKKLEGASNEVALQEALTMLPQTLHKTYRQTRKLRKSARNSGKAKTKKK